MTSGAERGPRRGAVVFVFVSVALDCIALGVIAPVFVPLIERFMHDDVRRAAAVVGGFGTVFAVMQFVWAPVLGVLVRPLRPQAGHRAVEPRHGGRLRGDGARAEPRVAARRAHRLRDHVGER